MKVVINNCFGGFSVSKKCAEYMASKGSERAKKELEQNTKGRGFFGHGYVEGFDGEYERTDPLLVEAVETLKEEANGNSAELKVVEIPDDIEYYIHEYDGYEEIHENHHSWR